jgi:hypothetical protein
MAYRAIKRYSATRIWRKYEQNAGILPSELKKAQISWAMYLIIEKDFIPSHSISCK